MLCQFGCLGRLVYTPIGYWTCICVTYRYFIFQVWILISDLKNVWHHGNYINNGYGIWEVGYILIMAVHHGHLYLSRV